MGPHYLWREKILINAFDKTIKLHVHHATWKNDKLAFDPMKNHHLYFPLLLVLWTRPTPICKTVDGSWSSDWVKIYGHHYVAMVSCSKIINSDIATKGPTMLFLSDSLNVFHKDQCKIYGKHYLAMAKMLTIYDSEIAPKWNVSSEFGGSGSKRQ